jgi:hypothetical protein
MVEAEAGGGGGGSLQVSRSALRQAAGDAAQVSAAVGKLAGEVDGACLPAASAHAGWQFGQALAALAPAWQQHLHGQSASVSAASGNLTTSADNYETVESGLVAQSNGVLSRLVG